MIPASLANRITPDATRRAREIGHAIGWLIAGARIEAQKRRRRDYALARAHLREAVRFTRRVLSWTLHVWLWRLAVPMFFVMLGAGYVAGLLGFGSWAQRVGDRALRRLGIDPMVPS